MATDLTAQSYLAEETYHRLCSAPEKHLPKAIDYFGAFFPASTMCSNLSEAILGAGIDASALEAERWGSLLESLMRIVRLMKSTAERSEAEGIKDTVTDLLSSSFLSQHAERNCLFFRAKLNRDLGHHYEALADFGDILKNEDIAENQKLFLYNRGMLHRDMNSSDLAIADFSAALERTPDDLECLVHRYELYTQKEEFELAIVDCDRLIQIQPDRYRTYYNRGVCKWNRLCCTNQRYSAVRRKNVNRGHLQTGSTL